MNSFKPITKYLSRYIGVIVLSVLSVVSIYVGWSYIWPKYQEIQMTRDEIKALSTQKEELTNYVAYLHELETTSLPFEEELVNYAIPSENDVISLIVTYEGLAKTPDVVVSPFDLSPGLIQSSKKSEDDPFGTQPDESGLAPSGVGTSQSKELEFSMQMETEKPEIALDFINSIHKTRRLFNIKSLLWENPDKSKDPNNDTITLSIELGTYYYQGSPKVSGSAELVNRGRTQTDFIAALNATTIYDALILDTVEVGKEDLFVLGDAVVVPTPQPNPAPAAEENVTPTVIPPSTF